MSQTEKVDVVIVGAGPAGSTAGLYLARQGYSVVVLTGEMEPGGALTTTSTIENFPGFPDGVEGSDLATRMIAQAQRFGARIIYQDVAKVEKLSAHAFSVHSGDDVWECRAVVLATGSAYRHLRVPGEESMIGHGVSYCATCDGFFFRGKDVLVIGGGDSAASAVIELSHQCHHVRMLVRSDHLRASKVLVDRVTALPNVDIAYRRRVVAVLSDDSGEHVQAVRVCTDSGAGALSTPGHGIVEETQGIFVEIGSVPQTKIARSLGAQILANGYVQVGQMPKLSTQTSVPGLFAAGDVADARYRQAITAAGSGAQAAQDVRDFLDRMST